MRTIIILTIVLFSLSCNAQSFAIGTKKSLKPHRPELKAPDFLAILKKSRQPAKKDSTEIYTFNGFADSIIHRCSFDVHTFQKSLYKYENKQFEYLDSVSSAYYVYQNQKIVYKEIWLKSNGHFRKVSEIYYYKNGKPKSFYSYIIRTKWLFDKNGNTVNEDGQDKDHPIKFNANEYTFTNEEEKIIRYDLSKIALNFENSDSFELYRSSIKDWKVLNKTKKYLKKLFKTDVDLYYDGMSSNFISFYSEYGKFYTIENRRVFEMGVYDDE